MSEPAHLATAALAVTSGREAALAVQLAHHVEGAVVAYFVFGLGLTATLGARLFERLDAALSSRLSGALVEAAGSFIFAAAMASLGIVSKLAGAGVDPTLLGEVRSGLSGTPFDVLLLGTVVYGLRVGLGRAGRGGWTGLTVVGAVGFFAVYSLGPIVLPTLSRGDAPAAAGGPLLEFVRRGGLPADRLYVFKGADPASVDLEGAFGVSHAAVSQAAMARPDPETYAALGHLLGHFVHGDMLAMGALYAGFFILASLAAAIGAPYLMRRLWGAAAPAPLTLGALPAVALVLWGLTPVERLSFNLFDQAINYRADAYALSLTRDAPALGRWAARTEGQLPSDPGLFESLFFYDHPPLRPRLARILGSDPGSRPINLVFAKIR